MSQQWGHGRVAVLQLRDEIAGSIKAGHSLTAIFKQHQTVLGIGYDQFTRLVKRHITGSSENKGNQSDGGKNGGGNIGRHTGIADPATLKKLVFGG